MRRLLPAPRLLPITMAAMMALMGVKSVALVRAAVPNQAEAAQPMADQTKPGQAKPGQAKPGPHAEVQAADGGKDPARPHAEAVEKPESALVVAEAAVPNGPPPVSEAERTLLLELRERRTQLDARDAALQAREQVLAAAEHRLSTRLDELTALRGRLEALETARKEHDDANWHSMVKLYESMKPRDAAVIFNDLDMSVLLQVVDRMKETRAAPVLAAMQPDRARQLTAELAQMRSKANTPAPAAPARQGG